MTTKNVLKYKGYRAELNYDSETKTLHGKIAGIKDLVTFESNDTEKIIQEFHDAVDDYIEFCKEVGKQPEKTYNGVFNVRITPEAHKKLADKAMKSGLSLNTAVKQAISNYLAAPIEPIAQS